MGLLLVEGQKEDSMIATSSTIQVYEYLWRDSSKGVVAEEEVDHRLSAMAVGPGGVTVVVS